MNQYKSQATSDDLTRIMELLTEYTDKLRAICEEKEQSRFRRLQIVSLSLLVMMTLLGLMMFITFLDIDSMRFSRVSFPLVLLAPFLAAGGYIFLFVLLPSYRIRYSFQATQIAKTVEKLITLASQYSEHSTHKISDKFEFDLRVAEAEAALHMYESVFASLDKSEIKQRDA